MDKDITGKIVVKGIITFTIDREKSKNFGKPIRTNGHEQILSIEELNERLDNDDDDIHKYGFAILYSFDGVVNGEVLYFDKGGQTSNRITHRVLGYSRACVKDGDKVYMTFNLNEDHTYERPSSFYEGPQGTQPDLIGAIKLKNLEIGSEIKFRKWRQGDEDLFPHPILLNQYYEPGHFTKAASFIMPPEADSSLKASRNVKKRGRKPDPNKEVMYQLPAAQVLERVRNWINTKSEKLRGFELDRETTRVIYLDKALEGGYAHVKLSANGREINISYLTMEKGEALYKTYAEWNYGNEEFDEEHRRKEILTSLHKLLAAY